MDQVLDAGCLLGAHLGNLAGVRQGGDHPVDLLVVLQILDGQIAGGVPVPDVLVLLDQELDAVDALLQFRAVVDVDVSGQPLVVLLVDFDHGVQQLGDAGPVTAHGRTDRHTKKITKLLGVKAVSPRLQLIVHVQSHHHTKVHVDNLGREVEVPLDVGSVHDIDHDIRHVLDQVLADVEFLRAVG